MLIQNQAFAAGFELIAPPIAGGQSLVYKALHSATGNSIALKVFNNGTDCEQILREAASLASIKHKNIASFIAAGYIGKQPYVATEWIDGERLCDYKIDCRPLGYESAWHIVRGIGSALSALHDRQVIHGDLSPANIIIKSDGTPVLIDFGLGAHIADQTTAVGASLGGTPRYIAPEIILGEVAGTASDQHSLVIILYELLSANWPFADVNDQEQLTSARALHHQLYSEPVPLTELDPRLDSRLNNIISTALHKQPDQRFSDVHLLMDELSSVCDSNSPEVPADSFKTTKQDFRSRIKDRQVAILTAGLALSLVTAATVWAIQFDTDDNVTLQQDSLENTITQSVYDKLSGKNCNLIPNGGFDQSLSDNFYREKDNPDVVLIIDDSKISSTPVLRIGNKNEYGLYGQIVPINPDNHYQFKANIYLDGYVEKADLVVEWLDSDWQQMPDAGVRMSIAEHVNTEIATLKIKPPESARYAVPTVFKNASSGILKVDNLVFSVIGVKC